MSYSIFPLGDSGLTIDFGNIISEDISRKVLLLAKTIENARLPAVKDVVPAYSSVTVHYDVVALLKLNENKSAFTIISEQVKTLLSQRAEPVASITRSVRIPVCYALHYGIDLPIIAEQAKLKIEEIIDLHTKKTYRVYMIGFLPGFAYMGNVDERIAVARKTKPRLLVDAGCVGIAGEQTGIYPLASPGGWQIIGKTPIKLFNKNHTDPVVLKPGDEVQFYSITEDEFNNY